MSRAILKKAEEFREGLFSGFDQEDFITGFSYDKFTYEPLSFSYRYEQIDLYRQKIKNSRKELSFTIHISYLDANSIMDIQLGIDKIIEIDGENSIMRIQSKSMTYKLDYESGVRIGARLARITNSMKIGLMNLILFSMYSYAKQNSLPLFFFNFEGEELSGGSSEFILEFSKSSIEDKIYYDTRDEKITRIRNDRKFKLEITKDNLEALANGNPNWKEVLI